MQNYNSNTELPQLNLPALSCKKMQNNDNFEIFRQCTIIKDNTITDKFDSEIIKRNYVGKRCQGNKYSAFNSIINTNPDDAIKYIMTGVPEINSTDFWGNNVLIALSLNNKIINLEKILDTCINTFSEKVVYDFFIHLVSSEYLSYNETTRIKLIKSLLWKIDVESLNRQDDFGNTVVTHSLNSPILLRSLLENKNINLELANLCGNNPVSYCVQNGNNESLVELINFMKTNYTKEKTKQILNHRNELGESPILISIKNANTEITKLLLNTGLIDCNVKTHDGKSVFLFAIEKKMTEICNLFLDNTLNTNVDLNCSDNFGNVPVIRAIELDNYKLIFNLLNKKANLNCKDAILRTPLVHALILKYRSPKILETIRNKSEPFGGFTFGYVGGTYAELSNCFNPLGTEEQYSGPEAFMKMTKMDMNVRSSSQLYDVIISKIINSAETDVNVSDIQGNTPFSLICENKDTFLFDVLMSNNTFDPHHKNIKGISSYEYIRNKYNKMLCDLFGTDTYCPLDICNKHEKYAPINKVISSNADIVDPIEKKLLDQIKLSLDKLSPDKAEKLVNFFGEKLVKTINTIVSEKSESNISDNNLENFYSDDDEESIENILDDNSIISSSSVDTNNNQNKTVNERCNKSDIVLYNGLRGHIEKTNVENTLDGYDVRCRSSKNYLPESIPLCSKSYIPACQINEITLKEFAIVKYFYECVKKKLTLNQNFV